MFLSVPLLFGCHDDDIRCMQGHGFSMGGLEILEYEDARPLVLPLSDFFNLPPWLLMLSLPQLASAVNPSLWSEQQALVVKLLPLRGNQICLSSNLHREAHLLYQLGKPA